MGQQLTPDLSSSALEPARAVTGVSKTALPADIKTGSPKAPLIYLPITSLVPNPRNARKHSKKQINKLAASIKKFGFINPVIIDEQNMILVGHCRVEAAKLLGSTEVPTIRVGHLTETQKRAYALADNRLAEDATWDLEILAIELTELLAIEIDFSVDLTGFEPVEVDQIFEKQETIRASLKEVVPELDRGKPAVSLLGDLWLLGPHRLLCGNATSKEAYALLMADERAEMVFTDPPWNVPTEGHICGLGAIKHAEFIMAAGEMTRPEFIAFLRAVCQNLVIFSVDGSIHYLCFDWGHLPDLLAAADGTYTEQKNLCVWNKTNAGMGSFYRSKYELVAVFKNGSAPHINNFGLGGDGRYRTNVWDYPGVNIRRPGGRSDLEMHPTAKPVALVMDAIKDCSRRGGIILDPFSGSGTTIIAAQRTGRIARAMELDPAYVDLALRRWEALTGDKCRHAETGLTLDELAAQRGVPTPHLSFESK